MIAYVKLVGNPNVENYNFIFTMIIFGGIYVFAFIRKSIINDIILLIFVATMWYLPYANSDIMIILLAIALIFAGRDIGQIIKGKGGVI